MAEDRSHWVDDASVTACTYCEAPFTITDRRHHCRQCGKIFCGDCSFYRAPCEKSSKPNRLCLECIMNIAYQQTGVPREEPIEKRKCVVVGVNGSQSFKNIQIESDYTHPGITGEANAKFDMEECYVDWIQKDSNGTLILSNCLITGDIGMEVGGNNQIELRKCIVLGSSVAVHLTANAKIEAWDTFFIATGVPKGLRSIAIRLEANAKARIFRCTVIGSNGVVCTSNAQVEANGGLIVCQKSRVPGYAHYAAIIGKHELNTTEMFGVVKEKALDPFPVSKVGKSAAKALRRLPSVGHITKIV